MKIANAARALFVQSGYSATSMKAIAASAGVSEPTVYARFRNKRAIIDAIMDSMDTQAGVLDLIEAVRAADGDRGKQIDLMVEFDLRLFERNIDVYEAAARASASEPGLGAILEEGKARGRAGRARVFEACERAGTLRSGLDAIEANDIFTAIVSPFTYREMVVESGWAPAHFEAWVKSAIRQLLLADG